VINVRTGWGLDTTVDLAALVASVTLLLTAIRLMWRADLNDYFSP
jgi:hypothetical protein